jgi:hypothetical protein
MQLRRRRQATGHVSYQAAKKVLGVNGDVKMKKQQWTQLPAGPLLRVFQIAATHEGGNATVSFCAKCSKNAWTANIGKGYTCELLAQVTVLLVQLAAQVVSAAVCEVACLLCSCILPSW